MGTIFDILRNFFQGARPWATVSPWEQGIRVRLGKHVKKFEAGIFPKIPFIDSVYIQSIRTRVSTLGKQTLTSLDGKCITLAGSISYCINDIECLYQTLHHAEDTIANIGRGAIAEYVATHSIIECTPAKIEEALLNLPLTQYGIGCGNIIITDFAIVRTYRLIGDYLSNSVFGSGLSTEKPTI